MFKAMKYIWFFIGLPFLLNGQPSSSIPDLLNCTHQILGTSNILVSGTPYVVRHRNAKSSPFFKITEVVTKNTTTNSYPSQFGRQDNKSSAPVVQEKEVFLGEVYIKGNHFSQEYLSYDLEINKLILYKKLKSGTQYDIALSNNIIDSFYLDKHLFISTKNLEGLSNQEGYLEKIFDGKFSFYQAQTIYFLTQFSEKTPYGKFSEPQKNYFVYYNNEWSKVSSFKDFLKLFPEAAKEIKRFAKKEKIRFKKANKNQFTRLLNFSHEQL